MLTLQRFVAVPRCHLLRPIATNKSSRTVGIIDLILSEHQYMRDEYESFKSVNDVAKLDTRVRQWIAYVALHGHKEEIAFYPQVEAYLNDQKKGGYHLVKHGIKEHRELEVELKKLAEQKTVDWKQIDKAVDKLMHHLKEEERDILAPLRSKLDDQFQLTLAQQFEAAGQMASDKPHPELTRDPERAPQESIRVGLVEKRQDT